MTGIGLRARLKARSLSRLVATRLGSKIREVEVRGVRVRVQATTDVEEYRVATYLTKEPETLDWIDRMIEPGDVLYDLGANIGIYSLYAAAKGVVVMAFEPEALNFAQINHNIVANPGLDITAFPLAVGSECCLTRLYSREFAAGVACHGVGRPVDQAGRDFTPANKQGVMVLTLDQLWQEFGLPAPNHIKVDVDGGETGVLAGAVCTLHHPGFRSILVEVTGPAEQIMGHVGHLRLASSGDPGKTSSDYPGVNHVFVREPDATV